MAIDRQKTETVHWHAVFTASRAEKKVRDRLEELGVECFLPVQTVLRQWTYRKSRVVVPVIAGLVFVRVGRQEQVKVLQTKGVVAFLRLTKVLVRIDMLGCAMVNIPASFVEKLNK